ncbi:iron-sulfur cluster assembly accessory protein [Oligoflexus tunisiensis]|uniref:iron-sulfur cluster assembly accessory protein n=1 Tax=Oligoflexus tunisiensis TaxID=708132 RepID=UPI00114CEF3E|nr:iron-sulfur cluster assembly accessory protein [Oligoflexus tunisiensis]
MDSAIHMSPRALEAALDLQQHTARYRNLPLRLYLDGKGCDGFYYGVTFDPQSPDDLVFPQEGGLLLIIDRPAFEFCRGSTIEWIDDERGTGFLVENPHQWKFRGKFFKRKAWIEKLEGRQSPDSGETLQS